MRRPISRDQKTTIVYGILCFVVLVVILQLWLLTATMNAWLGGDRSVLVTGAVVPRLDRGELHCPCHNGYFEAEEGRPVAGPPRRPLPLVTLEVADDTVYATGFELRTI